jgi:hypothetical protein
MIIAPRESDVFGISGVARLGYYGDGAISENAPRPRRLLICASPSFWRKPMPASALLGNIRQEKCESKRLARSKIINR